MKLTKGVFKVFLSLQRMLLLSLKLSKSFSEALHALLASLQLSPLTDNKAL